MKILKLLLVIIICSSSIAQENYFGAQVGASFTNVTNPVDYGSPEIGAGLRGGLTYECVISDNFHVGLDALYSQKGYRSEFTLKNEEGWNTISTEGKMNYNYFALAVKAGYSEGDVLRGFINVGLAPSYLLNVTTRFPGKYTEGIDGESIEPDEISRFDLCALGELGLRYLYDDLLFYGTLGSQYGLLSIKREDQFHDGDVYNFGFLISVGVRYRINQ